VQAEGSILSCDQLWRTHIEGQARVKAEQSSSTQTGEKQAALRRGLHAQMAAHAYLPVCLGPTSANSIFEESEGFEKADASKVVSFGPLCLSSDSTLCQLSESLANSKIRRAVRP